MNYFELYPGDYLKATGRLTLVEHGAYLRLLMEYYATEQPLPADDDELFVIASAIKPADRAAVKKVADRYFPVAEDGLRHNERADAEIEKAQKRMATSRQNGAKGGRPKKPQGNPPENPPGYPAGNPTGTPGETCSGEALQTPHASPHADPDNTLGTDNSPALDTHRASAPASRTAAGEACLAMRRAGMPSTSPAHPELLALIAAGATPAQFGQAAALALSRGKGFGYALGVLKGQLAGAAAPTRPGKGDPEAVHHRNAAVANEWLRETAGETP